MSSPGPDIWPECGYAQLTRNDAGWLQPTEAWWRRFLTRPELALVDESCRAERALHRSLLQQPTRHVHLTELAGLQDADARENWRLYLGFRDALLAAGTLEAWTLQLFRSDRIDVPPLFIDLVVQAILRGLLERNEDAIELRAAELLFRPQRITLHEGRVLAGDRDTLDLQSETGGLGDIGRLLAEAKAPLKALNLRILSDDNAGDYIAAATTDPGTRASRTYLLDLTHEIKRDVGHGLLFTTTPARGGLKALARVLERWVQHLLGVTVSIEPASRIDDPQWRWHVGLDADASALLNDLYAGNEVDAARTKRLLSLFKLRFENPAEMRHDVAGKTVYLGMMMNSEQVLRVKPQNLLLNLPLATAT
ncbi:MAG: DUF6352 family protein [Pseudomonadota bacterium]|nr:DUF6352 family protein [Pseudomonadota bacterium]